MEDIDEWLRITNHITIEMLDAVGTLFEDEGKRWKVHFFEYKVQRYGFPCVNLESQHQQNRVFIIATNYLILALREAALGVLLWDKRFNKEN